MRHKGVDKEETRQKIREAVGRGFRKYGYSGIGVDGLAKAAGVTSGAFYSHFGSKDGAFEIALTAGLDEVIEGVPVFQNEHGGDWVKAFVDYYLGKPHRVDLECGCAMATLTPEVVRFDTKVHAAFEKKMTMIADLVANGLAGSSNEDRRARAWSMLGVLIGGLNVVRALNSTKVTEEVSEAIKAAAIKAAGRTRAQNKF
ncbi:MAG: TetR/AcrR family transcriptional regulator [Gammaproteobacteria bacterium]|nr:TetR/AcrR family transcriptional regulator [Gammaproteobacteria bacterium]